MSSTKILYLQVISISSLIQNYFGKPLSGGKPLAKRKSNSKLVDIKESSDICDIWKTRNLKCQTFPFRQNHSIRITLLPLDFIFTSYCVQEFFNYTVVLTALSTDNSLVLISLSNDNSDNNVSGIWKFDSFVACDEVYVEKMNNSLQKFMLQMNLSGISKQNGNLEYETRKFMICYSKTAAKIRKQ